MKVTHLGKFYPPVKGGMETMLAAICEGTAPAVHSRAIVANDRWADSEERHRGVEVLRVRAAAKVGAVAICPTLPFRLAKEQADIFVIHEPNPMALVAYYLARPRGRLVVWFHSEVIRSSWQYRLFYRPLLEFALSRASKVVVASPTLAATAGALKNWQSKCVVIPFGIPLDQARNDEATTRRAEPLRQRHGGRPLVLFVGRLVPYKGVDVLIDAIAGGAEKAECVALLVGNGPERESLEARARTLGVADRVKFLGEVDATELAALYRACDVFVLPSVTRQEAFGVVQIEAMARGKPVISTDLGTGTAWVNRDGETGLVVAPRDAPGLRAALDRLLEDCSLRARFGSAAEQRARALFSEEQMIQAIQQLFNDVAAERVGEGWQSAGKRLLDMVLAGTGLLASAPLWIVLAAIIKLEDGGPIFFAQERVGLGGRRFAALKFRSMIPDAEAKVGAIQSHEHDPRVTRIGRLMRATAMDELPQLWNIFRGDMSFVGPRALRPGEIEVHGNGVEERLEDVPGFDDRCAVRPGLTGIAQIYAPRDLVRRQKFRYDRFYIRRQSMWLDIRLILLSFWITFRGTWEARGKKF